MTVVFADRPSRAARVGLGLITVLAGGLVLGWPNVGVLTVAVIVGLHLIAVGVIRVVAAFTGAAGLPRVLYVLLGSLLAVAGILCLLSPFHAIALLVVLFGVAWIVNGVVELCHGFAGGGVWTAVSGAVSLAAGIAVLAYPAPSARVMVWLFGLALVAIGLTVFVSAVFGHRRP
jgi:uncharacterized membrane protein HdeD (DUF308 family)